MKLTRDALIEKRTKEVPLDGGTVTIRALTAAEAFEMRGKDMQSAEIFGLIAASIVEPVVSAEDVGLFPASMLNVLTTEIFAFNALGPKAIAEATSELKKTQSEGKSTT